jgi:hypothetical protein
MGSRQTGEEAVATRLFAPLERGEATHLAHDLSGQPAVSNEVDNAPEPQGVRVVLHKDAAARGGGLAGRGL